MMSSTTYKVRKDRNDTRKNRAKTRLDGKLKSLSHRAMTEKMNARKTSLGRSEERSSSSSVTLGSDLRSGVGMNMDWELNVLVWGVD